VSSRLYVWRESVFISADDARARLERADSGEFSRSVFDIVLSGAPIFPSDDDFDADETVATFYSALLAMFPALEDSADDEGVWTMTPKWSDRVVRLRIAEARERDVVPVVRELAKEFGLVCYDPDSHALWPNVPGYEPSVTLWSPAGLRVPDPDPRRVEWAVKHLTHPYAGHDTLVVDAHGGPWTQACYGEHGADGAKTFAIERGHASANGSYWAVTDDESIAVGLMLSPLTGETSWLDGLEWQLTPEDGGA
jgi:hypothetical protein